MTKTNFIDKKNDKKITLFGKRYERDKLPEFIKLDCGCMYSRNGKIPYFYYTKKESCGKHEFLSSLDETKRYKINELNLFIKSKINKIYSRETQFNILALINKSTVNDRTKMLNFINNILEKQEILKKKIQSLNSLEKINNFDIIKQFEIIC